MRLLYVPLNTEELDRLKVVAQRERRRPQDQAAVMLAQALASFPTPGYDPNEPPPAQSQTAPRREEVAA